MTTTAERHSLTRRHDQLEEAQARLDECIILQDEIRGKLVRIRQLTGIKIDQFQDLEDVGTVEEMVREEEG